MKKIILITLFVILVIVGLSILWQLNRGDEKLALNIIPSFADGKYLGYIHKVDMADLNISFDDAVWLIGTEGENAAIEAGHCTKNTRSECLPNGYIIKNAKAADVQVQIDKSVLIFMQTWKMEETGEVVEREISLSDFVKLINDQSLHWWQLPYNITIQNGKITKIEEVYIP